MDDTLRKRNVKLDEQTHKTFEWSQAEQSQAEQRREDRKRMAKVLTALAALLTAIAVAMTSCLPLVSVSASGRPISTPWDAVLMQQLGQALLLSGGSYTPPLPKPGNAKAPGEQQQQSQSQIIDCGQKDCPDPAKVVVPPDYYDK